MGTPRGRGHKRPMQSRTRGSAARHVTTAGLAIVTVIACAGALSTSAAVAVSGTLTTSSTGTLAASGTGTAAFTGSSPAITGALATSAAGAFGATGLPGNMVGGAATRTAVSFVLSVAIVFIVRTCRLFAAAVQVGDPAPPKGKLHAERKPRLSK